MRPSYPVLALVALATLSLVACWEQFTPTSPAGDDDTSAVGDDDTSVGDDDTSVGDDDTSAGDDDSASNDCVDDHFEENDTLETAAILPTGTTSGLVACLDDLDHYRIDATPGESLTIEALFSHANGDVDITLYDPDDNEVGASWSEDDNESLGPLNASQDYYVLEVSLYNDAAVVSNSYSLVITTGNPIGDDDDTAGDDDDTAGDDDDTTTTGTCTGTTEIDVGVVTTNSVTSAATTSFSVAEPLDVQVTMTHVNGDPMDWPYVTPCLFNYILTNNASATDCLATPSVAPVRICGLASTPVEISCATDSSSPNVATDSTTIDPMTNELGCTPSEPLPAGNYYLLICMEEASSIEGVSNPAPIPVIVVD